MSDRPNLLFVFADQMRGTDMGCAGNRQVRTPNLNRLAAEGTRFAHAYANCPVCTPSRGTILTGRYPHAHRAIANDMPLPTDQPTIAKTLRDAGYRTGYVGKWHLDGVPRNRFTPPGPRRQGFDFWAAWNCAHAYMEAKVYRDTPEAVLLDGYEPIGHTDLALEFLKQADDRPFCLFLSWGPPHAPYDELPDAYKKLYDASKLKMRPNLAPGPRPGFRKLGGDFSPQVIADYYAHITALDEQLGRLLAALQKQGQADNTLVIFTSDHGDMLWSQGMTKKEQPWEESILIPFIVRWPGRVQAGRETDSLLSTVDFTPTLLRLMGVEPPAAMQGADLSEVVLGAEDGPGDSVFLTEPIILDQGYHQGLREWRGVRTSRYTYSRSVAGEPWLLYDNKADPFQMNNLAESPDHAALRDEMERELQKCLAATGDPCLPWQDTIRSLGLVEMWNEREEHMHAHNPRLLEP